MLNANNLTKAYGDEILFSDLSLNASAGDRIALVGTNGSGKSTLMDILAGETIADRGKVSLKRNCKVAYLKQENYKFENRPLLQEVCQEPEEILGLRKELRDIHELLSNGINKQTQSTLLSRMGKIIRSRKRS